MDYPAHRAADVVLSDGSTAHVRPVRPEDADALRALHSRLSERTRYLRYFSAYPRMPERDLYRFANVDHALREALVALRGDQVIAVGRYEGIEPDTAEVAFVVEDAHQGRGISSVLLEHLAAAAREAGIRRFIAEVLPENRQMARVFTEAGYVVDRSYADGVVHLAFDTAQTERSLEVLHSREQSTEAASIARLLAPRSVAVIGVGRSAQSIGRAVFSTIRAGGFTGECHPVNPALSEVDGVPCVASVRDIAGPVDLAVIAVPASEVASVAAECAERGVHGLVVISSGFGETGQAGLAAERALVQAARAGGARVVGPNCLGVLNTAPDVRLNATLAPTLPGPGRVGFFSQSGALGIALLEQVDRRGIGLSTFVSAGNRADVSGNDLLQYWQDDPATDVVLLYLETFGNPRKFARVARRLARRKPVVVLKGRAVPPGLAGLGRGPGEGALQALFEASGVIRVDTLDQLFDVAQLLAYQPLPAGERVAIVGNSSALSVLAAAACTGHGLLADPRTLPTAAAPHELAVAARAAAEDPGVDAVLVVFVPVLATPGHEYADALREAVADAQVPVLTSFLAASGVPERLRIPGPDGAPARGSVPSYSSPEGAVAALAAVGAYSRWRRRPFGRLPTFEPVTGTGLLERYGISVWPSTPCSGAEEAVAAAQRCGFPVAVKAAADTMRHRADLGWVRLGLRSPEEVHAAAIEIVSLQGADGGLIVQPMAPPGVACVVEVMQDSAFGPIVGFGLGGVATELLGDRAWRAAPLTDLDAAELLRAPLAAPMLFGYRGAAPVDTAALEDLLLRVGLLADEVSELAALSLNPVLATADGCTVLHGSLRLAPQPPRLDSGPRRL